MSNIIPLNRVKLEEPFPRTALLMGSIGLIVFGEANNRTNMVQKHILIMSKKKKSLFTNYPICKKHEH